VVCGSILVGLSIWCSFMGDLVRLLVIWFMYVFLFKGFWI